MVLASLGSTALVFVGASLVGDMLVPTVGASDTTLLMVVGALGGLATAVGLSLAARS